MVLKHIYGSILWYKNIQYIQLQFVAGELLYIMFNPLTLQQIHSTHVQCVVIEHADGSVLWYWELHTEQYVVLEHTLQYCIWYQTYC
jgi:hypothetical protein